MTEDHIRARIPLSDAALGAFCARWQIRELSLFGSVLRPDFRADSDVDILVRFEPNHPWSLFDHVEMQDELSTKLGRKVDLVSRAAIERSRNYIRRQEFLGTAREIYAA